MPFPLAHPAAVLPLRRFCPRYLNFPALLVGSVCPDFGYFSGQFHWDNFSHCFAGSFGFCLPVGLSIISLGYLVRPYVNTFLPGALQPASSPLYRSPIKALLSIVVSVLIGTWTHLMLDSVTHQDGWMARRLFTERYFTPVFSRYRFSDVMYAITTFLGLLGFALFYLNSKTTQILTPRTKTVRNWIYAFSLSASILLVALASRGVHPAIKILPAGLISGFLIIAFLVTTYRPAPPDPQQGN